MILLVFLFSVSVGNELKCDLTKDYDFVISPLRMKTMFESLSMLCCFPAVKIFHVGLYKGGDKREKILFIERPHGGRYGVKHIKKGWEKLIEVKGREISVNIKNTTCEHYGDFSCRFNPYNEVRLEITHNVGPFPTRPYVGGYPPRKLFYRERYTFICSAFIDDSYNTTFIGWKLFTKSNYWREVGYAYEGVYPIGITFNKETLGCVTVIRSTLFQSMGRMNTYRSILCKISHNVDPTFLPNITDCPEEDPCPAPEYQGVDDSKCNRTEWVYSIPERKAFCSPTLHLRGYPKVQVISLNISRRAQLDQTPELLYCWKCSQTHFPLLEETWSILDDPEHPDGISIKLNNLTGYDSAEYMCTIEFYLDNEHHKKVFCDYRNVSGHSPQMPEISVDYKKPEEGLFTATGRCSGYVGTNGKLTWYLGKGEENQSTTPIYRWPLYGYGWPNPLLGINGTATVENVVDDIDGTRIDAKLQLDTMTLDELNSLKLDCVAGEIAERKIVSLYLDVPDDVIHYVVSDDEDESEKEEDPGVDMVLIAVILSSATLAAILAAIIIYAIKRKSSRPQPPAVPEQNEPNDAQDEPPVEENNIPVPQNVNDTEL